MMKTTLLACVLVAMAAGCDDEAAPPRTPAPLTDPQPQPHAQEAADRRVVEKIAVASCEREKSCGTIGPGATFSSQEDCMQTYRDKTSKSLNASMCPNGISQKAVEECLTSLEANQCSQTGDEITRSARCPASSLCMR